MEFVAFTLIVDDIVTPDGRTHMQVLGGGGSQTLFGYQLCRVCTGGKAQVGLAAGVGKDLPTPCTDWLSRLGVDLSGLIATEQPTPRAWQIHEYDGRRTQVWRTSPTPELLALLLPPFDALPVAYQSAKCYHLGVDPLSPPWELLKRLHAATQRAGGVLSVETYTHAEVAPSNEQLQALLRSCDVFSANELEAASLVGQQQNAVDTAQLLLEAGAKTLLLRRGEAGVLVADCSSDDMWMVPAVEATKVVDVTGCGNACCGGFAAHLLACQVTQLEKQCKAESLRDSAVWGCVSASFMAEADGIPQSTPLQLQSAALQRFKALQQQAHRVVPKRGLPIMASMGRAYSKRPLCTRGHRRGLQSRTFLLH